MLESTVLDETAQLEDCLDQLASPSLSERSADSKSKTHAAVSLRSLDGVAGIVNLFLALYILLRYTVAPIVGALLRPDGRLSNEVIEPALIALGIGLSAGFFGREKLQGRRPVAYAQVQQSGGHVHPPEPLGALFVWLVLVILPYAFAILGPLYLLIDLITLLGR